MIDKAWYTQPEEKSPLITLKQEVIDLADVFISKITNTSAPFYNKNKIHLMVKNSKKILLEKMYDNLEKYILAEKIQLVARDINKVKPGIFTNPSAKQFIEPTSVTLLLTKKHNKREKLLCEEALKANIPLNIIMIGEDTMLLPKAKVNLVSVTNIKDLYVFYYAMAARNYPTLSYDEFRTHYKRQSTAQ